MSDWLTNILAHIGDARVAEVLREQVKLLQLQRDTAAAERDLLAVQLAQAQAHAAALESANLELQTHLEHSQRRAQDALVPFKGALWRRKPGGGFFDQVLCRQCQNSMVSFNNTLPFACRQCGVTVDFTGMDLTAILLELKRLQ
jgi:hypothetical protein